MKHDFQIFTLSISTAICASFAAVPDLSGAPVEKMQIAIMDFESKDIPAADAEKISELIRNEMINTGKYTVIERTQMTAILKEQGFQQAGCADISCAVEIGKILSARKILVGSVMKLGSRIIITGRIVDIEKGVAWYSEKSTASDWENIPEAVVDFVNGLSGRIGLAVPEKDTKPEVAAADEDKKDKKTEEVPAPPPFIANPYSYPAFGLLAFAGLTAGGGYYYNTKVASLNSDNDKLAERYAAATSYNEAAALHDKMDDNTMDAKRYALYRNILYGAAGASLMGAGYFLYRYLTYEPASAAAAGYDRFTDILPVFYAYKDVQNNYSTAGEGLFVGCALFMRF